ncbi:MAG TPA: PQQ-dependent sugar dehydrogenase [Gaiellaceae bacterium]
MLAIVATVLIVGAGSGAAICHYTSVNCHVGRFFFSQDTTAQQDEQLIHSLKSGSTVTGNFAGSLSGRVALTGFTEPTDFAFLTPKRLLVSEKRGVVWEASLATNERRIVLDLRKDTSVGYFRGLVTVAADPDFARDHFIYVLYSVTHGKPTSAAPTTARLTRYTLGANGEAQSPHVLLGTARGRSCSTLPSGADCIPSDLDHLGAEIAFAPDGTMFISTGDGGGYDSKIEQDALRAQDVNALGGKVLHITRSGLGVPSNPFFDGNPKDNRSKVWAIGLRNPFRLARDPQTGALVAGDVGAHRYDEIDVVHRGDDLGWPCYEGDVPHPPYASSRYCRTLYARGRSSLTWPTKTEPSTTVIVGGAFLPKGLARDVHGTYLFASLGHGWLRAMSFSARDLAAVSHVLAEKLPGPVAIHLSPAGGLYILCLGTGDLLRISSQS